MSGRTRARRRVGTGCCAALGVPPPCGPTISRFLEGAPGPAGGLLKSSPTGPMHPPRFAHEAGRLGGIHDALRTRDPPQGHPLSFGLCGNLTRSRIRDAARALAQLHALAGHRRRRGREETCATRRELGSRAVHLLGIRTTSQPWADGDVFVKTAGSEGSMPFSKNGACRYRSSRRCRRRRRTIRDVQPVRGARRGPAPWQRRWPVLD